MKIIMVISSERSGSTIVQHFLQNCPEPRIENYSELLWKGDKQYSKKKLHTDDKPILERVKMCVENSNGNVSTFKLFLDFMLNSIDMDVIDELNSIYDIDWYLLERKNKLNQAISMFIASKTGIWGSFENVDYSEYDFTLTKRNKRQINKHINSFNKQYNNFNEKYDLTPKRFYYEDFENNIETLFDVFGIKKFPLNITYKKLRNEKYEIIKKQFLQR
jgi:hypothetical protein